MITVALDAGTLARTRLAPSPVRETVSWLRAAVDADRHPFLGRPSGAARSAVSDEDVSLAAALVPPHGIGYTPDFLTPKPGTDDPLVSVRGQLEALEATPAGEVAEQVAIRFGRHRVPYAVARATEAGTLARRVAAGLARFWRWAVADDWPGLLRIVEEDLAYRAELTSRAGLGALIGGLHPTLGFAGGAMTVDLPPWEEHHEMHGVDLVLAPSVLGAMRLSLQLHDADNSVISYPVTPRALQRPPSRPGGGADLLGRTRSAVLEQLHSPRSTTDVSRRLRVSPATVSHHLGVLLRAGLVARSRCGHEVLYTLTAEGRTLAGRSASSAS